MNNGRHISIEYFSQWLD